MSNISDPISKDIPVQYTLTQYRLYIPQAFRHEMGLEVNTRVVLRVFKGDTQNHILVTHIDNNSTLKKDEEIVSILAYGSSKIMKDFTMALPFDIRHKAKGITRWSVFQADLQEGENDSKFLLLTLKDEEKPHASSTTMKSGETTKQYKLSIIHQAKQQKSPRQRKKKAKQFNDKAFSLSKSWNLFVPDMSRKILGWSFGEWKLIRVITNRQSRVKRIIVENYDDSYNYYKPKKHEKATHGCWRKLRSNRLLNLTTEIKAIAKKHNLKCAIRTRRKKKYLLIS